MRHRVGRLAAALLLFASPVAAQDLSGYEAVRQADLTLARVGEKLAIANLPLCRKTQYRTGLLLHDIRQYSGGEAAARKAFGFERDISVEAVVPGSAAERAGVAADTGVTSLDGKALDGLSAADQPASFARMAAVLDALEQAAADGTVRLAGVKDGKPVQADIRADKGCDTRFQLVISGGGTQADGRYVQITANAFESTGSDNDLAALMAHEFAHNILEHRARLDDKKVSRGMLGQLGKNAGRIKMTEEEADRLSVYLMLNADYDPEASLPFMDRFLAKYDLGFLSASTHPRRKRRLEMLRAEIVAARALRARTPAGQVLIPDFAKPPFAAIP